MVTLLPLCALAADENQPSSRVVFLPHWIPLAQFAGYFSYTAQPYRGSAAPVRKVTPISRR